MDGMTIEIQVLGWAGLLAAAQVILMAVPANLQLGSGYLATARDEPRPLSGVPARLERAWRNHLESLLLFAVAVLVVSLGGRSSPFTEGCALAYLAARIVYVPLYGFGVKWWRTAVWAVGFVASILMLLAALF